MAYITNTKINKKGKNISQNTIQAPIYFNKLLGDTTQSGTPSPSTPIVVQNITGLQTVTITDGTNTSEYNFNLSNIELCKIGNYQDYIYKENNKWYKHSEIGKIELSGTTGWWASGTHTIKNSKANLGITNIYSGYLQNPELAYSNYFAPKSASTLYQGTQLVGFGIDDTGAFYLSNNDWSLSDCMTFLNNNDVVVYYLYDTPTTIEITDEEVINGLNILLNAISYNGTTNITTTGVMLDIDLCIEDNPYEEIIYSQDDKNKAKIWFNDVELQDFGLKCEKITKKTRIIPEDGKKIFSLSNFVSTELEIILHDVDLEDIVDQVKISIGTLIDEENETYQYVPLGVFNIQDTPVVDNNKLTLKLRDNRVKFDFGYNAKPIIDAGGGSTTKRAILNDICIKAGVEHNVPYFEFEDDEIGIYDDSIKASTYIYYLAEQCGCIPTINRDGVLLFINLNNLYTWRIPKSILPKPYTLATPYKIERVVYEQGITKYESSSDESLDTLFLDSTNPYIDRQEQIDYIYGLLDGFTIDSASTQKMLGNPAIDPYDLIEIYDDSDEEEPVIFRTLANQVYTFNGKHWQQFNTEIGKEQRKENVKKKTDDASFRRWATTEINNLDATVAIQTGKLETLENTEANNYADIMDKFNDYATIENIESIETSVTQLQTDTYTKTQIQEIANGTGVDGVTVTAVISTEAQFDSDGMHYSKTDAPTSSTINYKGLEVDDTHNQEILYAGYDDDVNSLTYGNSIVRTGNLTVNEYLQLANNKGRFEEYTDSNNNTGVGFFLT